MSLNDVYKLNYEHAIKSVLKDGGKVNAQDVTITRQKVQPVKFEQGYEGVYAVDKVVLNKTMGVTYEFDFEGIRFSLRGASNKKQSALPEFSYNTQVYIDGKLMETTHLSTSFRYRRHGTYLKIWIT